MWHFHLFRFDIGSTADDVAVAVASISIYLKVLMQAIEFPTQITCSAMEQYEIIDTQSRMDGSFYETYRRC